MYDQRPLPHAVEGRYIGAKQRGTTILSSRNCSTTTWASVTSGLREKSLVFCRTATIGLIRRSQMSHFAIDQRTSRCSNEQTKVKQHKCSHGSTAWRCSRSTRTRSRFSIFALIVAFVSLVSVVAASADPTQVPAQRRQTFADLGARRVMERAAQATDGEEESSATTTIPTSSGTSSTAVASATTTTVLPQPFDTTLGNNFTTESCPRFFSTFLSDPTFRSCYPFSLLLQTSHGFFEAEKNFFQTTVALQAGCSADYDVCNNLMHSLSNQLKSASACMSDYAAENQIVMQAYRGLLAYPVMYQAACLQDEKGDYCEFSIITYFFQLQHANIYDV